MVYTNKTEFFFTSIRADSAFQNLKHGDIVTAKILSLKQGGSARIFFNGANFEGKVLGNNLKEGDSVKMRVVINSDKILLVPENENPKIPGNETIFSKLGLPKNELTSAVLSFFISSNIRLDETGINKIIRFLKNTKKDKNKAAFAAGLIESKGISLDKNIFDKVYSIIFGEKDSEEEQNKKSQEEQGIKNNKEFSENTISSFNQDFNNDDLEIFEMINHIRDKSLQWIVMPFKKNFENAIDLIDKDKNISGTIALLLDTNLKTCKTIVLRCKIGKEIWIFSVKDKTCTFMQEKSGFTKHEKESMENLLSICFAENSIFNLKVKYGSPSYESDISGLDIMA